MKIFRISPISILLLGLCIVSTKGSETNVDLEESHEGIQFMGVEDELSLLFVIHRHGDRSPSTFPPLDPHKERASDTWTVGPGMLTNEGKQRMYQLGQYLRRRYSKFLSTNPREVYSISSDVDRCIESSQVVLASMYKPVGEYIWNKELSWQPMPVHTRCAHDDPMLNAFSYCPRRKDELKKVFNSVADTLYSCADGEAVKKRLTQDYGLDFKSPFDYSMAYTTLSIEKNSNLRLKPWFEKDSGLNFHKLASLANQVQYFCTHTDTLKKLFAGVLLDDILEKIHRKKLKDSQSKVDTDPTLGKDTETKLFHYSTHDFNIHALLSTLGVTPNQLTEMPRFGSTILIELHKNKLSNSYLVKLFFLNKTEEEEDNIKELELTDCLKNGKIGEAEEGKDTVCFLDEFDRSTKKYHLKPRDWFKECGRL